MVTALAALAAVVPAAAMAAPATDARTRAAKKVRLQAFDSCPQLVRYGRLHARRGSGALPTPAVGAPEPLSGPLPPRPPGTPPTPVAAPQERALDDSSDSSGTNVQEAGVDEPDLVKAARGRVFVVAGSRLNAIDVTGMPRLLGSLDLDGWGHELLLSGDRLLVIGQDSPFAVPAGGPAISPMERGEEVTQLTEVDVSDPAAMRTVRTERIRGRHVSARLTGRTARVVVWTRPRAVVEPALRSQLKGWLPRRVLRKPSGGKPRFRPAARCRRVLRPAAYSGTDLLTVLTIDLAKGLPAVDSDAIMSAGQVVYASPRNLYVATPRWIAMPDTVRDTPPDRATTTIHEFSASDPGRTSYSASGEVPGFLLNQFALSEHRGVLRVASTEAPQWWGGLSAPQSQSLVTTLEKDGGRLRRLGQVGGLGLGERVFAVRFIGDVGYVVTFRQVDPLYVVDLAAPRHPRVAGELKVRGYSAYLHPLGGDLLLGIGQDATERGQQLGSQLSLFDVSDPSKPRRLDARSLGANSSSEVEQDHHAFLWWPPKRLAVVPVSSWQGLTGALGFRVGSRAISEVGRTSHASPYGYGLPIRRSLVVRGKLVTISDLGIALNSIDTLAEERWLAFSDG